VKYHLAAVGHDSDRFWYSGDCRGKRIDEFLSEQLPSEYGEPVRFAPSELGYQIHESFGVYVNGVIVIEYGSYVHDPSSSLYDYEFVIEAPESLQLPNEICARITV
jgi:hypothetical protein